MANIETVEINFSGRKTKSSKKKGATLSFKQWQKKNKKKIEKNKWSIKKQKAKYKEWKLKQGGVKANAGRLVLSIDDFAKLGSKTSAEDQKVKSLAPKYIGLIGSTIVFMVNKDKVFTFQDFERTTSARWAEHERLGKKPKKQFMGADCDRITLTITIDAALGVNPRKVADNIRKLITEGTPRRVIIGNKRLSKNKFIIKQMSDAWDVVHRKGQVTRMTCKLELEEYL